MVSCRRTQLGTANCRLHVAHAQPISIEKKPLRFGQIGVEVTPVFRHGRLVVADGHRGNALVLTASGSTQMVLESVQVNGQSFKNKAQMAAFAPNEV
jgi:hypothetical protein